MSKNELIARIEALNEWEAIIEEAQAQADAIRNSIKEELADRGVEELIVERFGKDGNALYRLDDKGHFLVTADVGISDAFYSWISSFRKKAAIISPPEVVEGMKQFLLDIQTRY